VLQPTGGMKRGLRAFGKPRGTLIVMLASSHHGAPCRPCHSSKDTFQVLAEMPPAAATKKSSKVRRDRALSSEEVCSALRSPAAPPPALSSGIAVERAAAAADTVTLRFGVLRRDRLVGSLGDAPEGW
jgi:hypothetical protein